MVVMLLRKDRKPESTLIVISLLNHCIDHLKPVVKLTGNIHTHRCYLCKMFTSLPLQKSSPTEFSANIWMWKITYLITLSVVYIHANKGFNSTPSVLGNLVAIHQKSLIKLGLT